MAMHGTIAAFSSAQETWTVYVEGLEQFFAANKIEDADQQRAIALFSVYGPATYRLTRNLVSPKKPTEFKFAELIDIVQQHHDLTPSLIVQQFSFNSRTRRAGESIAAYVAELHQLAEHCKYDTTLNDMLRDWLVCGVDGSQMQQRLLAEPQLTFDEAFEIAMTYQFQSPSNSLLVAALLLNSAIHRGPVGLQSISFQDLRREECSKQRSLPQDLLLLCYLFLYLAK